ncbi:MAG: carboxypeptidase-like regulatory domain-containing protein, partial [Acidobacteriota bacterium]
MKLPVFRPAMAWTVFAFVLLSTLPTLAQRYAAERSKSKNTLQVKCVDQAGNPLKGIKVEAREMVGGKKKNKKCNAAGVAVFEKLDSGVYELVARQKGFEPSLYDFVLLEGGSQESVTLVFKPGDKDKPLYFEDDGAT